MRRPPDGADDEEERGLRPRERCPLKERRQRRASMASDGGWGARAVLVLCVRYFVS